MILINFNQILLLIITCIKTSITKIKLTLRVITVYEHNIFHSQMRLVAHAEQLLINDSMCSSLHILTHSTDKKSNYVVILGNIRSNNVVL